jgi:aminoglycoside phosphotransferase (APT) family kinase protein
MASCPKELERNGPTQGMSFSRQQAEKLFKRYLNKKLIWFETTEGGLNNLIFFIECENDNQKYVLKICGNAWTKIKTESEITAINLVHKYTQILLPKIVAYSSDKNNEFDVEWIVMTRLPGKPLRSSSKTDDIWPELTIEQQKLIINQLVEYVSQFHNNIPRSNQIGNYHINGKIGSDSNGMGPWNNYKDFYNDRLKAQIKILYDDPLFEPIRDDVMKSVKEFLKLELPSFDDVPNVFTHNDLGVQNLIVSDDNHIRGIIDWEWSGSYPVCEEYFRSYKPIVYNDQLKNYLYDQLEQHNVATPRTIPHFSLLKKMSEFLQSVVPWYLTNLANPEHPIVEKELNQNRDKVKRLLQQIKEELK